MKLAEALTMRADLQKRLAQLGERLNNNAKVQEGDSPAEEPKTLLAELDQVAQQLEQLIARINLTNAQTLVEGETLTELIARKDVMTLKNMTLRSFLSEASSKVDRYSNKEIRIQSTVDVRALQKSVDDAAAAIRALDTKIQMTNWTTDLIQ